MLAQAGSFKVDVYSGARGDEAVRCGRELDSTYHRAKLPESGSQEGEP
jgi:hypothetical protein